MEVTLSFRWEGPTTTEIDGTLWEAKSASLRYGSTMRNYLVFSVNSSENGLKVLSTKLNHFLFSIFLHSNGDTTNPKVLRSVPVCPKKFEAWKPYEIIASCGGARIQQCAPSDPHLKA